MTTDAAQAEWEYAAKARVHLWTVSTTSNLNDEGLDLVDHGIVPRPGEGSGVLVLLGEPTVACLVCLEIYTPRLRRRRCPGDATQGPIKRSDR